MQGISESLGFSSEMVADLVRDVSLTNGRVTVSTGKIEGAEYAFYLEHPNGLEKVFYSKRRSCMFSTEVLAGSYRVHFFYRIKSTIKTYILPFTVNESEEIQTTIKEVVKDAPGYRIEHYDVGSDITFIVFNGAKSKKNSIPFGYGFLTKRGYNVVACLQDDNQYQALSFMDFKEAVQPLLKGKSVFLYGSSLGGYAAFYYAGAVGGVVIASAPRNSAHPLMLAQGYGSRQDEFLHVELVDNPVSSKAAYVFIDPYIKADVYFFENIISPAYKHAKVLKCEYAGHEVLFHLNATGQLAELIDAVVRGRSLSINSDLESKYTDYGRAWNSLNSGELDKAVFYAQRILRCEGLSERERRQATTVVRKALSKASTEVKSSVQEIAREVVGNNKEVEKRQLDSKDFDVLMDELARVKSNMATFAELRKNIEELSQDLSRAKRMEAEARRALAELEASTSYKLALCLRSAAKSRFGFIKLPVQLWRLYRKA